MTITHTKVVDTGLYPNDPADPRVQGEEWNDGHAVSGYVAAPASSTDNAVVRFDGVTGELVQDSSVTIDDNGNIVVPGTSHTFGTDGVADTETFYRSDTAGNYIKFSSNGNSSIIETLAPVMTSVLVQGQMF